MTAPVRGVLIDGADCPTILTDLVTALHRTATVPTPPLVRLLDALVAATGAVNGSEDVTPPSPGRTLTTNEYARLAGCSPRTARDRAARGELPATKRGRQWLIETR